MSLNPQQYAVYKGMSGKFGAVQFNFQAPHYYNPENTKEKDFTGTIRERNGVKWKVREGAVFVDITSAKGKNEYDWDNKITFALSVNDIGKILFGLRTAHKGSEIALMHDPGAKSESAGKVRKHIKFSSPQGPSAGFLLSVTQVTGKEKRSHTVPLSPDEVLIVGTLLQTAVSRALAW